jgi:hypothetical protein
VKLQLVVIGVACIAQRGWKQDCSRVQNDRSKILFSLPAYHFIVSLDSIIFVIRISPIH